MLEVLRECELQHRNLLIQRAEFLLVGIAELGTAIYKTLVGILQYGLLLGCEREVILLLIYSLHACEERRVEVDVVAVSR